MPKPIPIYRPRKPQDSQYYQCVEDHFETLEQVYEDRFSRQYGFLAELCQAGDLPVLGLRHPA